MRKIAESQNERDYWHGYRKGMVHSLPEADQQADADMKAAYDMSKPQNRRDQSRAVTALGYWDGLRWESHGAIRDYTDGGSATEMTRTFLDKLYDARDDERAVFGERWRELAQFEYGKDTLIAVYPKSPADGDGTDVEVYCCAMPARFYIARVRLSHNSVGEPRPPFEIHTGSGIESAKLIHQIAEAVSAGMLGVYPQAATLAVE